MTEQFKALFVLLILASTVFVIIRRPICPLVTSNEDFSNRRNSWYLLTASSFVVQNVWIYLLVAVIVLAFYVRKGSMVLGTFLILLFTVPPFNFEVRGIPGIEYLLSLDHPRVLSIILLGPVVAKLMADSKAIKIGSVKTDWFVISYIALPLLLQLQVDSITNTARWAVYAGMDVFLPYYVASRLIRTKAQLVDALMSLAIGIMICALVSTFEYQKSWLLYSAVPTNLGSNWQLGSYMMRDNNLRSMASGGHSIVLGYMLMVGLALVTFLNNHIKKKILVLIAAMTLAVGLFATGARGPWIGALAVVVAAIVTSQKPGKRILQIGSLGLCISIAVAVSPYADRVKSLIPFIGSIENEDSVIYRQRLLETSLQVIGLNPILGSFDYMRNPLMQNLIQGEGIIDLVNSYIGITLTYGLVGLAIFSGILLTAGVLAFRTSRIENLDIATKNAARSLVLCLVGISVTISTASSISFIPWIYWIIVGLCVACQRVTTEK